jgi:hypothetical protein
VREPDGYLVEPFDQHPDELVYILAEMAADRPYPPTSPSGRW